MGGIKNQTESKAQGNVDVIRGRDSPGLLWEVLMLLLKIIAIVLVFVLLFTFMFGILRYEDSSMNPAVKNGDLVIFYRLDKNYVVSDTLVIEYEGTPQVRRVIATEGDVVDITEEGLMINGALQQEHSIYEATQRFDTGVEFPLTVAKGEVFILGDAREEAIDSRVYGAVDINSTRGKVMTIIRRREI